MGHGLARSTDMAYVGATPWHNLGVKLDAAPGTTAEMIQAAGLNWSVSVQALSVFAPGTPMHGQLVPDGRVVVRDDTGKQLGVVGKRWTPMQNADAFTLLDPFVAAGGVSLETAGCLFGGERVWMLAKLNRDPITVGKGDDVEKYMLIANGHNDELSTWVGFTPTRVVCTNTLALALPVDGSRTSLQGNASNFLRIRHSKGNKAALADVAAKVDLANAKFEEAGERYRALAKVRITDGQALTYFRTLFPPKPVEEKEKAPPVSSARPVSLADIAAATPDPTRADLGAIADATVEYRDARCISILEELRETGPGAQLDTAKGTAWGAYNAVTRWVSQERGKDNEARAAGLLGQGGTIVQNALAVASSMFLGS